MDQGMKVIFTSLIVAMEEMVKQGKELIQETDKPDMASALTDAVGALETAISGMEMMLDTDDMDQMPEILAVMQRAQEQMSRVNTRYQ